MKPAAGAPGARGRMTGAAVRAAGAIGRLRARDDARSLRMARIAMATNATVAARKISRCPRPGAGSLACAVVVRSFAASAGHTIGIS